MTSIYDSAIDAAASDQEVEPAALKAALEAGPHDAEAALAAGLIDRVGFFRDAEAMLLEQAGDDAQLLDMTDYFGAVEVGGRGPVVAVVRAEGVIITGTSGNQGLAQGQAVFSDDVAKAFYDAAEDDDVEAIVFRVSSPGGSDTASEQIRVAVEAAKAAGKPVVVSMGTYAASGGYWISSGASRIIAEPTTLTGSIGVYGGKFALGDALARVGVDVRGLSVGGEYADAFGMDAPFTPTQQAAFSAWMDRIYDGFVARVAEDRGLAPERVREIANGRVWTGEQAHDLQLVDELGGFYQAVSAAKQLAEIDSDQEVRLRFLPEPQTTWDLVRSVLGVSAGAARTLAAAGWVMGDPRAQSVLDQVVRARLGAQGAAVLAPQPLR
jgi:protease-4